MTGGQGHNVHHHPVNRAMYDEADKEDRQNLELLRGNKQILERVEALEA